MESRKTRKRSMSDSGLDYSTGLVKRSASFSDTNSDYTRSTGQPPKTSLCEDAAESIRKLSMMHKLFGQKTSFDFTRSTAAESTRLLTFMHELFVPKTFFTEAKEVTSRTSSTASKIASPVAKKGAVHALHQSTDIRRHPNPEEKPFKSGKLNRSKSDSCLHLADGGGGSPRRWGY